MKIKIKCICTVNDLNNRKDLQYVSDSQEVTEIKSMLGFKNRIELNDFQ
jgi:ribosomal protein L32E